MRNNPFEDCLNYNVFTLHGYIMEIYVMEKLDMGNEKTKINIHYCRITAKSTVTILLIWRKFRVMANSSL